MANTENIEAKLCAYIDGELDAQGRAEIEKHLAANPQHRTLIEELSKQRDLLRELPREGAPEEILEALQSQMERSVLLGDDDAGGQAETMKIQRWPQVFAMAAMVLLTVGLGVVIYFVLPRGGNTEIAITPAASVQGDGATSPLGESALAGGSAVDTRDKSFVGEGETRRERSLDTLAAKSSAPPAPMKAKGGLAAESLGMPSDVDASAAIQQQNDVFAANRDAVPADELLAAQDQLQNAEIASQLKDLKQNAMFVVVSTADPSGARSQVTNYLVDNKISWDDVPHPLPKLDLSANQSVNLMRQQRTQVTMKAAAPPAVAAAPGAGDRAAAPPAAAPVQEKLEGKSGPVGGTGRGGSAVDFGDQQQQQARVPEEANEQQKTQAPATQAPAARAVQSGVADAGERLGGLQSKSMTTNSVAPDEGLLQATTATGPSQIQSQIQQQARPAQPQQGQVYAAEWSERGGLIIARGMTKRQAQELRSNLAKQTTVQRAAVYGRENATAEQSAAVQARRMRRADAPTTNPAVPEATATTSPSEDGFQQVGSEDTIAQSPSAPRRLEVAKQTFEDRAKEMDAATTAPAVPYAERAVQLSELAAVPATGPATAPTTNVSGNAIVAIAPAEGDEPVDVVILVQDDLATAAMPQEPQQPASPAPNAAPEDPAGVQQPTTQPASDPAATQPAAP